MLSGEAVRFLRVAMCVAPCEASRVTRCDLPRRSLARSIGLMEGGGFLCSARDAVRGMIGRWGGRDAMGRREGGVSQLNRPVGLMPETSGARRRPALMREMSGSEGAGGQGRFVPNLCQNQSGNTPESSPEGSMKPVRKSFCLKTLVLK